MKVFIYFFKPERQTDRRGKEKILTRLYTQCGAWYRAWPYYNPEIVTWFGRLTNWAIQAPWKFLLLNTILSYKYINTTLVVLNCFKFSCLNLLKFQFKKFHIENVNMVSNNHKRTQLELIFAVHHLKRWTALSLLVAKLLKGSSFL